MSVLKVQKPQLEELNNSLLYLYLPCCQDYHEIANNTSGLTSSHGLGLVVCGEGLGIYEELIKYDTWCIDRSLCSQD